MGKEDKKLNFFGILNQDVNLAKSNRARRFAEQANRARENYIRNLEAERDKIIDQVETKFDVSATVDANILNAIGITKMEDIDEEVKKYFESMYKVEILEDKISSAKEDKFFMLND